MVQFEQIQAKYIYQNLKQFNLCKDLVFFLNIFFPLNCPTYSLTGESLGWAHTKHFNFRHTHKTRKKLKKNKIIVYQLM